MRTYTLPSGSLSLYNTAEAAELLQVTTRTIWNYVHQGKIQALKGKGGWQFSENAIREFLEGRAEQRPKQIQHRRDDTRRDQVTAFENSEILL